MQKLIFFLVLLTTCIVSVQLFILPTELETEKVSVNVVNRVIREISNDIEVSQDQNNIDDTKTVYQVKLDQGKKQTIKSKSLFIGECKDSDALVYQDNTIVDNLGPGILNGTIEVCMDF